MFDRSYESLIVWQAAHELCMKGYELMKFLPREEKYALASQIRRSSYSIPTNIVEGNSKRSVKQRLHFFEHAEGSLEELDYQIRLSRDLQYITDEQLVDFRMKIGRVSYLLHKIRQSLQEKK